MHCFDSVVLLVKLGKNANYSGVFGENPVLCISWTATSFLSAPAGNGVLLIFS